MKIESGTPNGVEKIEIGDYDRENIPSHVVTAHEGTDGVLNAELNGKKAVTLLTPSLDGEKAVSLSWTGIEQELNQEEKEILNDQTRKYTSENLGIDELEVVPIETYPEYEDTQEVMEKAWSETDLEDSEIIPTYEFESKDRAGNLIISEIDGKKGFAYMFPDPNEENTVYSHAVGVESKGIGSLVKQQQRERVLEEGYDKIYWTVDPLKPRNNRLNTTKLGGKATEYKKEAYDTDTSGDSPNDRFVIEWDLESNRVNGRIEALDLGGKDYVRSLTPLDVEMVLETKGDMPDYEESLIEKHGEKNIELEQIPEGRVGIQVPEDPIEDMDEELGEDAEKEWRYATRCALGELMDRGYEVTELMVSGENGFEQNTYILEN